MKRYVALFLTVVMVLFLPFRASAAYAVEIPVTASQTSVVMDISTGQVLVEKEMNREMYPASITKIMTVLLALENADPATGARHGATKLPIRLIPAVPISL